MLASEARQLAGNKYAQEIADIYASIEKAAKAGKFSVVVLNISDFVRSRLQDDGYALTKTHGWENMISW